MFEDVVIIFCSRFIIIHCIDMFIHYFIDIYAFGLLFQVFCVGFFVGCVDAA